MHKILSDTTLIMLESTMYLAIILLLVQLQPETTYNDLKQPTTNKKRSETTYNEQQTYQQRANKDAKLPITSRF